MEERVRYLETKMAVLEDRQARLEPAISTLTEVVDSLKSSVDKGRGAIWIMLTFGTALGVIGTWIVEYIRH